MPDAVETPSLPAPEHGGHCPKCGVGVLYLIAETADGITLRCFSCDTTGSIPKDGSYEHAAYDKTGDAIPTGFQMLPEQLEARLADNEDKHLDVEQLTSTASKARRGAKQNG